MKRFFAIDNPVLIRLGILVDFFLLNLVVILTSLPILTIIPCRLALSYTMIKYQQGDRSGLIKLYSKALQAEVKKSFQLSLLLIPMFVLQVASLLYSFSLSGVQSYFGSGMVFVALGLVVMLTESAIFYFSGYNSSLVSGLRTSFLIGCQNLALVLVAVAHIILLLLVLSPTGFVTALYFFTFGGISFVSFYQVKYLRPVFEKYET